MDLPGIDEALRLVLERAAPLEREDLALRDALGRFAAEPVRSAVDLPPFDSSAMDGYAVRAGDTPGRLAVVGASAAGTPADRELGSGEAIAISTGAVVPAGADAVVPVERTTGGEGEVEVEGVAAGENVRPRGGDVRAGDLVVDAGRRLGPPQLGAIAAAGVGAVGCIRRPRVALLATGSELAAPGAPLAPGQIYESNTVLLAAQLGEAGADVVDVATVADDPEATRAALERALAADVAVTSGGVSVGPHDLVRAQLAELGAEEVFWRVALRPGKPIAFAVRGRTLVFGLPGNPVSSLVGVELFVKPALLALQGALEPQPAYRAGVLASSLRRNEQRDSLVRARAADRDGATTLEPVTGQESHMIVRAAGANALVLVPRGPGELPRGAAVRWLPI